MAKSKIVPTRVSDTLYSKIEKEANTLGLDISSYIRSIIEKDLDRHEPFKRDLMNIYSLVSDLIISIENDRDYTEKGIDRNGEILHEKLNKIWDIIRECPQFHEHTLGFD